MNESVRVYRMGEYTVFALRDERHVVKESNELLFGIIPVQKVVEGSERETVLKKLEQKGERK